MEAYLPFNLEYDQIPLQLRIKIEGDRAVPHTLLANGAIDSSSTNEWAIVYPADYTSSSFYMHLFPSQEYLVVNKLLPSQSGQDIPLFLYTKKSFGAEEALESFEKSIVQDMSNLELEWGPWPHAQCIVYADMGSAMEYSGAMTSPISSLKHEMYHSYFGRGIRPANGDAGWIDEAVVSWLMGPRIVLASDLLLRHSNMGGRGPYVSSTPGAAYYDGEQLMAHLAFLAEGHQNLEAFFKELLYKYTFGEPLSSELFQEELESYLGVSPEPLFDKTVYGR